VSCLSSVPVSSPTRNIWRAAAGKRPVSASGTARPLPSIISSRMWLSPLVYTALLDASAVTAIARAGPRGSDQRREDATHPLDDGGLEEASGDGKLQDDGVEPGPTLRERRNATNPMTPAG